jgi:S-DNA-T family DNA segregation ATPase FtsK/SpoIIIE
MLLSTGNDLTRIQNAFIDTPEVERLVEFIASQRGYHEPYMLPDVPRDDKDGKEEDDDEDEPVEIDSMFKEAARLIVRYQIGSASLIQRKMKLGYNRAGRIIDQMERVGIVGAHNGSKSREVLYKDENELENLLSSLSR